MQPTRTENDRHERAGTSHYSSNEKLSDINDTLSTVTETFVISCECADTSCVEMLDIRPDEYRGVRADPRWFVVLPSHVYAEVESVIRPMDGYVVVEKFGAGAEVAEAIDSTTDDGRT